MDAAKLKEIIENHEKWLENGGGEKANLRDADLVGADLRYANLRGANLRYANLRGADLRDADLVGADLRYANLRDANLRDANLRDANLRDANLGYANLRDADLRDADLGSTDSILLTPFGWCHVQKENIRIGCQYHTTEEWRNFTDAEIGEMESRALDWWKKNKPVVMAMAEACESYEA